MKKEMKAYLLLLVCILMQAAAVFPHHHHSDRFCMRADLVGHSLTEACMASGAEGMHHSDDADSHSCSAGCITHFQVTSPIHQEVSVEPGYTFFSILYPLYEAVRLLVGLPLKAINLETVYIERLHARHVLRAIGLRAPPCC